jgi:hypothetical protein
MRQTRNVERRGLLNHETLLTVLNRAIGLDDELLFRLCMLRNDKHASEPKIPDIQFGLRGSYSQ